MRSEAAVSRIEKLLLAAREGRMTNFSDLIILTEALGFVRSTAPKRGSHHFKYTYPGWNGFLNYQILPGGQVKKYQVRQLMKAVESLNLTIDPE
jgi:hypothetical protein